MKKLTSILLISTFYLSGFSQIIRGTVFDKSSGNCISSASVFLNGTYIGSSTDKNGYFELDISRYSSMPLTISALGYYTVTLEDIRKKGPLLVYLDPKIFELNEVVINSKHLTKERKARLIVFKNEFLGITDNGRSCEIENEDDISFTYKIDTLTALSSRPIQILNKRLGYKISYYLDRFEYYEKSKSFFYTGSIIFNEDLSQNGERKQFYERNRKYAFLGSRMNFFRALWSDDLKHAGYTVKSEAYERLENNRFIQGDSLDKFLSYPERLGICYYAKFPSSYITMMKKKVCFDKNGYYDQLGIVWEGQMAKQRIGDILPYEYIKE